jgi:hypothetical protein
VKNIAAAIAALTIFLVACGSCGEADPSWKLEASVPMGPLDGETVQCFRPGPCGRQCRVDCGCPADTCSSSGIDCIQDCQDEKCRGEQAEPWPCPDAQ